MIPITHLHKSDTAHQKYYVISRLEGGGKSTLCRHCVTNENKISARTLVIKGLQHRFRIPGGSLGEIQNLSKTRSELDPRADLKINLSSIT